MDKTFLQLITEINSKINGIVWGVPVLVLIIATGIYYTFRLGFFQIRHIGLVHRNTLGGLFSKEEKGKTSSKALSQFQALSTALAATVGTGNIVGVTTAVVVGGPGAVFWMWISAFFGMMTKFAEITLGLYYREKNDDGTYRGGTMYSLEKGLGQSRHFGFLAKPLGVLFALFCMFASFGIGNMSQVNSISDSLNSSFGVPLIVSGAVLALISGLVIIGGIKRIGQVCERLVPFMSLFYIACTLIIIISNAKALPYAFAGIFSNAFRLRAVGGAAVGMLLKNACTMGFKRGVFSNEAGLGSSVMAHVNSDTAEPVKQGMWGIFEVFVDTIIICTLTALVILTTTLPGSMIMTREEMEAAAVSTRQTAILLPADQAAEGPVYLINNEPVDMGEGAMPSFSNVYEYYRGKDGELVMEQSNGASLMNVCFENALGTWAGRLLSVAIVLFAFSTVIGWSCYGISSVEYLFSSKWVLTVYRVLYVAATLIGATMKLGLVWDISDTLNGLMSIPNLLGLLLMAPTVVALTDNYIRRTLHRETIAPMISFLEK